MKAAENKHSNGLICSNSENSVMTCQSSTRDAYVDDSKIINSDYVHAKKKQKTVTRGIIARGYVSTSSHWGQSTIPGADYKDMKCSTDKHYVSGDGASFACFPDKKNN